VKGVHEGNAIETVRTAEAIYIGGGNSFRLLKCLQEENLLPEIRKKVLQDGIPYMGTSAGSNVATVSIHTTNDMPIVFPHSLDALGLVSFNINPHYFDPDPNSKHMGESRETRIKEFHEENATPVLVCGNIYYSNFEMVTGNFCTKGIREGSYLFVEGNKMTLLGENGAKLFMQLVVRVIKL
jgi:dipeptidase E